MFVLPYNSTYLYTPNVMGIVELLYNVAEEEIIGHPFFVTAQRSYLDAGSVATLRYALCMTTCFKLFLFA